MYSEPTLAFLIDSIGPGELFVILTVTLLLFGPKRLPEMSRKIGSTLAELRRASDDLRRQVSREIHMADVKPEEQKFHALPPASSGAPPALTEPRAAPTVGVAAAAAPAVDVAAAAPPESGTHDETA